MTSCQKGPDMSETVSTVWLERGLRSPVRQPSLRDLRLFPRASTRRRKGGPLPIVPDGTASSQLSALSYQPSRLMGQLSVVSNETTAGWQTLRDGPEQELPPRLTNSRLIACCCILIHPVHRCSFLSVYSVCSGVEPDPCPSVCIRGYVLVAAPLLYVNPCSSVVCFGRGSAAPGFQCIPWLIGTSCRELRGFSAARRRGQSPETGSPFS